MKKKGILILASVVVICALGLLLSHLIDWPIDTGSTSGNIAKSSRFSRKTADETAVTNMQELLLNDEAYKKGIVASYVVMETRAKQFDALVDMSNQVAGDIKEFEGVLKDMNDTKPMIDNVCASMATMANDLNGALAGESRPDLAQNTINASLAYTTLQKQNKLANKFIETTDNYLKDNEGSNELKFVRDQWLDYQQMTAALDKNDKAAADLQKKGYKLDPEQAASTLNEFTVKDVHDVLQGMALNEAFEVEASLFNSLDEETMQDIVVAMKAYDNDTVNEAIKLGDYTNDVLGDEVRLRQATDDLISGYQVFQESVKDVVQDITTDGLGDATKVVLGEMTRDGLGEYTKDALCHQLIMSRAGDLGFQTLSLEVNDLMGHMTAVRAIEDNEKIGEITNDVVGYRGLSFDVVGETIVNMTTPGLGYGGPFQMVE